MTNGKLLKHKKFSVKEIEQKIEEFSNINKKLYKPKEKLRRINISVNGIVEMPNKTWKEYDIKVQKIF